MRNDHVIRTRYAHEVAASLNLAFAATALFFSLAPTSAAAPFFRMDLAIYRFLNLLPRLTVAKDYYRGEYFAFFAPAVALAICLWLVLRIVARTEFANQFLRSGSAIAGISAGPIWWLCDVWRYGSRPFTEIAFYELLVVLGLAFLHVSGKLPASTFAVVVILLLHYLFWGWRLGLHSYFMGYGGPTVLTIGLFATSTWLAFTASQHLGENRGQPE